MGQHKLTQIINKTHKTKNKEIKHPEGTLMPHAYVLPTQGSNTFGSCKKIGI